MFFALKNIHSYNIMVAELKVMIKIKFSLIVQSTFNSLNVVCSFRIKDLCQSRSLITCIINLSIPQYQATSIL